MLIPKADRKLIHEVSYLFCTAFVYSGGRAETISPAPLQSNTIDAATNDERDNDTE